MPDSEPDRVLEDIARREVVNAMLDIARAGGGSHREELIRETNALFGFGRLAAKGRGLLEGALEAGLAEGRLTMDGQRVKAAGR